MPSPELEVLTAAQEIYAQNPDWVTYFREVLGNDGLVRRTFKTPEAIAEFEKTEEYQTISLWLAELRDKVVKPPTPEPEPTRVITIRLPRSLHESLKQEAHDKRTSMNKLCITKLLQPVNNPSAKQS